MAILKNTKIDSTGAFTLPSGTTAQRTTVTSTVQSFTSTGPGTFTVPTGVKFLDVLIVAGGGTMEFLTTDSTVKQIPHELSSFVVTQLKSMGEEAKVELGIQSQKDKILDEAKSMTTQQLLDKMKIDTNFANIILNK